MARLLLIGYGNPGRGDDALGWAVAEAMDKLGLRDLEVKLDYQLNVEHAFDLKGHDAVIFVDAALAGPESFEFRPLTPSDPATFSSHSVSPSGVLALARDLFGVVVPGYVLAVRGYEFDEFGAELSPGARRNLEAATAFLKEELTRRVCAAA
jgi:hydrogenase maturation protease